VFRCGFWGGRDHRALAARQHGLVTWAQLLAAGLDRSAITTHKRIPVTTIARMLVDLSDVQTAHELANVIHEAAFRGRFSLLATRDAMARANGRHDLAVLEKALALHAAGSAGTRSANEVAVLSMLQFQDLPEPLVNTHLHGEEVDFHRRA